MASRSKGFSFKELSQRDFTEYDDEDTKKTPKRNPFDFGEDDVAFDSSGFEFVSQSEVKDFLSVSRGITIKYDGDDANDASMGEPWGGPQYSIANVKESSDPAKSVRFRSTSTSSIQPSPSSFPAKKDTGSFASTPSQHSNATKRDSSFASLTTSKISPSPKSSKSTSHSKVTAAVTRERTGPSKVESIATTKRTVLNDASSSISDAVENTPQVSVNEYYRLQTEVGQLRRDLQAAKQSRLKPLPVTESVKRIIRGQPYSLELHKSLKDKVDLLNFAIKMHDGNAIIAVILFLKKTVKKAIFYEELSGRPKALHHYCKFLHEHYDFDELAALYRRLGKYEDAAMVKFKQAIKLPDPSVRLFTLKEILKNDVSAYPILAECLTSFQEYIKLLELQIDLELSDARAEIEKSNHVMSTHPRQASLPLLPVITTLHYCCFYHYGEPENMNSSPLFLRNTFKLSEKQYEWTALGTCAKTRRWKDIDDLLKGKGWFGTSKQRSLIGFSKVVTLLYQNRTPVETLSKYLRMIDDQNNRISLASKCKCHDVVIETLVAMKDRQKLDKYREQLPNHVPQQQTITNFLRNSQIKWKN